MGPLALYKLYQAYKAITLFISLLGDLKKMTSVVKVIGLVGALVAGTWLIFNGEAAQGAGIITAALSSASAFNRKEGA